MIVGERLDLFFCGKTLARVVVSWLMGATSPSKEAFSLVGRRRSKRADVCSTAFSLLVVLAFVASSVVVPSGCRRKTRADGDVLYLLSRKQGSKIYAYFFLKIDLPPMDKTRIAKNFDTTQSE